MDSTNRALINSSQRSLASILQSFNSFAKWIMRFQTATS
ncbi:hypothetical protein BDFB_008193 [Asbolus verrucosus]|uniref:Uncharacterized protein n=1 Tax=Asbolus verrucosus TaxID=1661398 RepID=A0A482VH47_ASBVE|nr:hypothetical protein BDFB_008193 [Asbolus verrucosus]